MTHITVMSKNAPQFRLSISVSRALRLTASLCKAALPHLPSSQKQAALYRSRCYQPVPTTLKLLQYYSMHQTGAHWQQTGSVWPVEPIKTVPIPARSVTTQDQVTVLERGCAPQAHSVLPTLWTRAKGLLGQSKSVCFTPISLLLKCSLCMWLSCHPDSNLEQSKQLLKRHMASTCLGTEKQGKVTEASPRTTGRFRVLIPETAQTKVSKDTAHLSTHSGSLGNEY